MKKKDPRTLEKIGALKHGKRRPALPPTKVFEDKRRSKKQKYKRFRLELHDSGY